MRTDIVTYYNGKRYMRRIRTTETWGYVKSRVYVTFAYRGVPDEWPVIISYTIR